MLAPSAIDECTAGRPLLMGFSGGLDSTVLLHLLASFRKPGLRAIHVDHGVQPDSDRWRAHCAAVCDELGVSMTAVRVDVRRDAGIGAEAAARQARHAAFESELRDDEVLVLAHHRDDQAETFLLRALRASGVEGLGSMRPWRRFGRGWLWRPLLDTPRAQLRAYAEEHGLAWIEDPSNRDDALDRNFLRLQVLPLLRTRWPDFDAAFATSAGLAAQAGSLLGEDDARILDGIRGDRADSMDITGLSSVAPARQARVLRRWIATLDLPPLPAKGVRRIREDLMCGERDSQPEFAWSGAWVRRWRDRLHAGRDQPALPADWRVRWDGHGVLPLPGGGELRLVGAEEFEAPVVATARRGGERIALPGRAHSHSLKHVLQDFDVPPWMRERLPLLVDADGRLLAAGDVVASAVFRSWLDARGAHLEWKRV
jgi:tRNA(Ile)-lysidine synthase